MAVLEPVTRTSFVEVDERAARRQLREQIARLEQELASAVAHTRPRVAMPVVAGHAGPRLLGLGELEELRDDLAPAGPDDTEFDDEGRPFHTHADGTVHYLDES